MRYKKQLKRDFFIPMDKLPTVTAQQKGVRLINGKIHHYTKPEVQREKDRLFDLLCPHAPAHPVREPVWIEVTWCFEASEHHPAGMPHTKKPDGDNLTKLLLDVMTKAGFWADDSLIADLSIRKGYMEHQGIYIIWGSLEEKEEDND